MQKTHTFSCIWGERVKLLLMKNKASNSTGDITMNQKIRVVIFFLTMQNDIRIKLSLTLSYLCVYDGVKEIAITNSRPPPSVPPGCSDPSWDHVGSMFGGISDCCILSNLCAQIQENITLLFAFFVLPHLQVSTGAAQR